MKRIVRSLVIVAIGLSACQSAYDEADAFGNFEADEITISAQTAGEIMELNIEEGMKVSAGQVLGYIDTTDLHLSRLELLANIEFIRSQYKNLGAQIDVLLSEKRNLQREIERTKKLMSSDAATKKQLDDLEGNLEVVNGKIAAIESQNPSVVGQINVNRARLNQVEEKISKSILVSPVNGIVLNKISMAHQLAMPGSLLYVVADMSQMILRAYISGSQLPLIKTGDSVIVMVDAAGGGLKKYPATVSWISGESEFTPKIIQTREERVDMVYAVKLTVKNDGILKIGMPGEVIFSDRAEN